MRQLNPGLSCPRHSSFRYMNAWLGPSKARKKFHARRPCQRTFAAPRTPLLPPSGPLRLPSRRLFQPLQGKAETPRVARGGPVNHRQPSDWKPATRSSTHLENRPKQPSFLPRPSFHTQVDGKNSPETGAIQDRWGANMGPQETLASNLRLYAHYRCKPGSQTDLRTYTFTRSLQF